MAVYRLFLAVLCGLGIAALGPFLTWIALPLGILILPGGFLAAIVFHSESAVAIIMLNAIVYSALAYSFLVVKRSLSLRFLRLACLSLVLPVGLLAVLALIPSLDPMFPRGMKELERQETELRNAFPEGVDMEQARAALRTKNIKFYESAPEGSVAQRDGIEMHALAGDHLIYSRFPTDASQFPCGYDMEVYLLFDPAGKLKQRYVQRFRVCP